MRFDKFLAILFVPLGAFVKKISDPMMLNPPANILPVTPLLWLAAKVPKDALFTFMMLNVPIPSIGPVEVVATPTELTSINSSANLTWSPTFMSAVVSTHISTDVVEIPLPELWDKVVVTGVNDIGDWMIPSMTITLFSVRFTIVKRWEFPAPTFVNVTALPPLDVASWKVLFVNFLTNTVVGKLDPPVICNAVAPTPAKVDFGV